MLQISIANSDINQMTKKMVSVRYDTPLEGVISHGDLLFVKFSFLFCEPTGSQE